MRLCAIAGHCALMRCTAAPHPNPLPEGGGTDRVAWSSYADLKYRAELRPLTSHKSAPFPLFHWERGLTELPGQVTPT
jgi:hypothetical protein